MSLVRQSAWHQLHTQRQSEEMAIAVADEALLAGPSTSKMASPTMRPKLTTPRQSPATLRRENTEQALLRWLNQEAIRPRELGFPWAAIPDLDRSWRNGRLLLALVHRFAPALVRSEEIMAGSDQPDEAVLRAERAMQLARLHLGIRYIQE